MKQKDHRGVNMIFLIQIIIFFICGVLTMVIHEVPKSIVAYAVTHPIYRTNHKINSNILSYIDPVGLIMFIFFRVGWQKPYAYNSTKFRKKNQGIIAVALTGMLSNLFVMALLIPLVSIIKSNLILSFVLTMIQFNFTIVIVNLLPVPPLEMSKIIHAFSTNAYFKLMQNERIIHTIFILLLIIGFVAQFANGLYLMTVGRLIY